MTPLGFPGTRPDGSYYPWLVMLEEPPGIVCGYDRKEQADEHAATLTRRARLLGVRDRAYLVRPAGNALHHRQGGKAS